MSVRHSAALALVAALVLAGCQDEPEPRFEPTPSDSSSPTDPETDQPEAQTAEEFIREWVELQRDMQNTGKTAEFLAASPGCRSCAATAQLVEGYYASGGFVRTEGRRILDIEAVAVNRVYDVRVESAPTEYRERRGGRLQEFPGGVTTYRVTLKQVAGAWGLTDEVEVSDS
jgi:hypothetical protein